MQTRRNNTRWLLIVTLAFVGFLLIAVPSLVVNQYQAIKNPTWARLYAGTVFSGCLLVSVCFTWILWRIWSAGRKKRARHELHAKSPSQLTPAQQAQQIDENLAAVEDLKADAAISGELRQELDPLVDELAEKRESQTLEIVAFGTISGGKSSLLNALAGRDVFATDASGGTTLCRNEIPWPGADRVTLVDTPGLGEVDGGQHQVEAAEAARNADIVLMVVDGPLRESEFELLSMLGRMEKRVLVCLNKEDWYSDREKESLMGQILQQAKGMIEPRDVVAVRSRPATRERRRILTDQTEKEETVQVDADIDPLARRMLQIVRRDGRDLLLANLLLQSRGLVEDARCRVRQALDDRAWEIVEKYMWGAGGAAALSPFPVVDLVAGCAISTKMVVDLARVYRQEVDLDVAVRLLGQLGKNLLAILGTSAALPAVAAAVASLLKTVPGAGTIAGGTLQGIVVALVTRWIGGVFVEYFGSEMQQPAGGLTALARKEWDRVTSVGELRRLVQAARSHLTD